MSKLKARALELKDWASGHRRQLHRYPELSLQEEATSQYCREQMSALGYQVRDCWEYGFIADLEPLEAPKELRRIAIRADMDALPIQEENEHDFVSCAPGVAHMCGHDTHMAIAMTAARMIAEQRETLGCGLRFIFQPSEELPPGGALGMIQEGCLEGVDEVYGLHNDPGTAVGCLRTKEGPLTAAADRFELMIQGTGCHAARPQDGLDPLVAGAHLVSQWQSLVARRINPVHPAVLSVTTFHAGTTFNIIPDQARLSGTIRTFEPEDRKLLVELMQASLQGLEAQGYKCEFKYVQGYDSIVNHKRGVERAGESAFKVFGTENVDLGTEAAAWGEDFAYYLQHRPGAFVFLGSGNQEKGIHEPLHSPRFDVDEDCLSLGAAFWTQLVEDFGNL